MNENPDLKLFR